MGPDMNSQSNENASAKLEELLDETQVAALICHSVRTLQKWRVSGKGPQFFKLGRSVRYSPSDVMAWVMERRRAHTSQ